MLRSLPAHAPRQVSHHLEGLVLETGSLSPTPEFGQFPMAPGVPVNSPLLPGADPAMVYHLGNYYLVLAEADILVIYRSHTLGDIGSGHRVVIHRPPAFGPRSCQVWAPEMHLLNGRWYVYYAADDGHNRNHRMYVLESESADPLSPYHFKARIADEGDHWAIDGTVLQHSDDERYFVWSGWEGAKNGQQNIYIARMQNPWTLGGPRVRISSPDQPWERRSGPKPCYVNEGPAILQRHGRTFIAYSANGFWSDEYCLGLLALHGANPLDPAAWTKSRGPVFSKTDESFNVGHNCFVQSPDGREDWIVYHAVNYPGSAGHNRTIRAQPFGWNEDGTPHFGRPVIPGTPLAGPSGEGLLPFIGAGMTTGISHR